MLKKLRIGFAAIVAILAITATVATHAGVFTQSDVSNGCYRDIVFQDATTQPDDIACPIGTPSAKLISTATLVVPATECPDQAQTTCCFTVVNNRITDAVCAVYEPVQ